MTGKTLYDKLWQDHLVTERATILSLAMLLRYSLNDESRAKQVEIAVQKVLEQGLRAADIFEEGTTLVGCEAMGNAVLENL